MHDCHKPTLKPQSLLKCYKVTLLLLVFVCKLGGILRSFLLLWFLLSSLVPMCRVFEMRTGSQHLCGVSSVIVYFSQLSNGIACRFPYCFCLTCFYWTCFSFLFEITLMRMVVSLASLSRSLIKQFRDNPHCPLTHQFQALWHPTMLLLVLMVCL